MTPREFSEAKQLYKFAIAYDCFWAVSKSCEHLMAAGYQASHPGYFAASVGIICTYCRPFTNNARIGMLSTRLVPPQFKELHSHLVELRDKGFAHTDTLGQLPGHGKMTEFRFLFTGTHLRTFSSRPTFNLELLPHIKALSDSLVQKVIERRNPLLDRVKQLIVAQLKPADVGKEFALNVEDEKGPMVVVTDDTVAHKYPVIRSVADL